MPPVSDVPPRPWPCSSASFPSEDGLAWSTLRLQKTFLQPKSTARTTPGAQLLRLFWAAAEPELVGNHAGETERVEAGHACPYGGAFKWRYARLASILALHLPWRLNLGEHTDLPKNDVQMKSPIKIFGKKSRG